MTNCEQGYCCDFAGHFAYISVNGGKSLIFEIVAKIRQMDLPFERFGRSVKSARDARRYDWFIKLGRSSELKEMLHDYNAVLNSVRPQLDQAYGVECDPEPVHGHEVVGGDLGGLRQDDPPDPGAMQLTHELLHAGPDVDLPDRLRKWRRWVACEQGVKQYVVLPNETLKDIARIRPRNHEELRTIDGIGRTRLDAHGDGILREVFRFESQHGGVLRPGDAIHRVLAAKSVLLPFQDRESLDDWAQSTDIVLSESAESVEEWFGVLVLAEALLASGKKERAYSLLLAISDGEPVDPVATFRLDLFKARADIREKLSIDQFNSMDVAEIEREVLHVLQQEGIDVGRDTTEGKFLWQHGALDVVDLQSSDWPFNSI